MSPIASPVSLANVLFLSTTVLLLIAHNYHSLFPLLSGEIFFMYKRGKKSVTCLNVSTSLLTLVLLAQGIQTPLPSPSTGDTPKKMSQACTRVMSSPWHPKTCTQLVSANSNVPYIPRTPNWDSRNNYGNGRGQIRGYPHFQ